MKADESIGHDGAHDKGPYLLEGAPQRGASVSQLLTEQATRYAIPEMSLRELVLRAGLKGIEQAGCSRLRVTQSLDELRTSVVDTEGGRA